MSTVHLSDMGQYEPKPIDLVTQLHEAVYGSVWARPAPPKAVWEELLDHVATLRMLAERCISPWMSRGDYPDEYTQAEALHDLEAFLRSLLEDRP